jgi:CDP-diacylglycerol--serine O-phosphatidyltransferase
LIPNLLTTGNLFFGYFSIIKSMQNQFLWAANAILLSTIFDILDGRVARLTRSTSEFGVQYDSLCDLVSFGLAPAILMYQFGLYRVGRIGWILCFIYLACGALRLARFNVQSAIGKANGDFTGLPIPAPAGLIACFVGFIAEYGDPENLEFWVIKKLYDVFTVTEVRVGFLLVMAPILAWFMVSNITFRSHKSLNIRIIKPFKLLVLFVVIVGLCAYKATLAGFLFFFAYALSGPVEWILGRKAADEDDIFEVSEKGKNL